MTPPTPQSREKLLKLDVGFAAVLLSLVDEGTLIISQHYAGYRIQDTGVLL